MIDVLVDDGIERRGLPDEAKIRQAAAVAASQAGVSRTLMLCLRVADDRAVRELNRHWRHEDAVTDVLSFPMQDGPGFNFDEPLGDIILAWPFVQKEARRLGLDAADHTLHLIIHGVLHLLGQEHDADFQADRMRAMERRAMRMLGLHDPYRKENAHI